MNFGGPGNPVMARGQPLQKESSQCRVGVQTCSLHNTPTDPSAQTLCQHRAVGRLANLVGCGHTRKHLGPPLVQRLLKTVPVHGKTLPNDIMTRWIQRGAISSTPGAWPPSPSPSPSTHLLWRRYGAPLLCVAQSQTLPLPFMAQKLPPRHHGYSPHPSRETGPGALVTPSEHWRGGRTEACRHVWVTLPLRGR